MTAQDLMKPRYKVIADYPNNQLSLGRILDSSSDNLIQKIVFCIGGDYWRLPEELDKYPHLYKKLAWWEDREVKVMPEFLKDEHGEVFRVEEYSKGDYVSLYKNNGDQDFPFGSHSLYELLPATLEEYESQNTINK